VIGPGTSTSDSIPTKLSNGEYVVNAENAKSNISLLNDINNGRISTGDNPYRFTIVKQYDTKDTTYYGNSSGQGGVMSFEPLNINVGGRIEITAGGNTQNITVENLVTPQIINKIIKEIQIQTDYSFDRSKVKWKYGI
jgi:hypothetical protein